MINVLTPYTGDKYPEVVVKNYKKTIIRYVPFDIQKSDNGEYSWQYVPVNQSHYNYGSLVDILIGVKYSPKEMMAIINNYLLDSNSEKYKKEFDEMQSWRLRCKEMAREHFEMQ